MREITAAIEAYKFNEAADVAYRFVWNIFCDWYLELAKPVLQGADSAAKDETRAMTAWVRDEILRLLHPFMPFITEELWRVTAEGGPARDEPARARALAPARRSRRSRGRSRDRLGDRSRHRHSLAARRNEYHHGDTRSCWSASPRPPQARAGRWAEIIRRLARLSDISLVDRAPQGAVQLIVRGEVAALPLQGVIDIAAEKARLEKSWRGCNPTSPASTPSSPMPSSSPRAPADVVEGEREKREEAETRRLKINEALERLKGAA